MTEDEMVGWHHQLNGHEFEETLGDSDSQIGGPGVAVHEVTKSWKDLATEQQTWEDSDGQGCSEYF